MNAAVIDYRKPAASQGACPGSDRGGAVHGCARHRHRERRAARDQGRPALRGGKPAVGDQRLRDPVRRRAPAGRPAGRRVRPPARVHDRPGGVLDQLAAVRPVLVGGLADRVWRAASGSGGAAGVLLGGFLTSYLNWSWVFFINVPVGIAVIAAAPLVLAESRGQGHRHFDVAGATSVTAGVMLLVYAMTRATQEGWGSFATVSLLGASLVLLAAFVAIELRSPAPLLPMQIFRNRMLSAANATAAVIGAIAFSEFFLLTLYMQQVLGYSAIETGVGFAAVTFTIIVFSNVAQTLVTRLGVRSVLATGLTLDAVALVWFTQLPVSGHYFWNLFPAFLISGVGLALSFVPVTIAGLAGVQRADAGVASGLINTSRQVGGAVGLAAVTTIAASYASTGAGATGLARVAAVDGGLTRGFQVGFAVLAGAAVLGAVISAVMLRPRPEGAVVEPLTSPSTVRLEEAA